MEQVFMCASIIVAIILCIVGIVKLPFKTFKEKHPNWYKATFCLLSIILAVVSTIIAELYILNGSLASLDFAVLIITTIAGVFGLYTSYEGLGLKQLVKIIVEKITQLFNTYSDNKLAKIVGTVGIEKLTEINTKLQEEQKQKEEQSVIAENNEQTVEVVKVDEVK